MILECKELTKWYGDTTAVADLTLNLAGKNLRASRRERKRQDHMDENGGRAYKAGPRRDHLQRASARLQRQRGDRLHGDRTVFL